VILDEIVVRPLATLSDRVKSLVQPVPALDAGMLSYGLFMAKRSGE